MQTINERIKYIRSDLGLSTREFGEKIGMSKSAVSAIETGKNNPSEQTIKLICSLYCVDYFWLTKGTGDPYIDDTDALIDSLAAEKGYTEEEVDILKKLFKLPPEQFDMVMKLIDNLKEQ